MNQLILTALVIIGITSNHCFAQEATTQHKDSLNAIVDQYYKLNLKIFQSNSVVNDIDNVFALFTDDFIYTHPKYGGLYTREVLYNGYVRNQKNDGYNGSLMDVRIVNRIVGLNGVVIERQYIEKKNGKVVEGDPQMTLFEFKDGKISSIFEYW
ncbi:MAG: nuclear transport factor 2 family protein [Cyclobacteriaceae bacterium]